MKDHPRGYPEFTFGQRSYESHKPSVWADIFDFYLPFLLVVVVAAGGFWAYLHHFI